jgi:hypothetical protein
MFDEHLKLRNRSKSVGKKEKNYNDDKINKRNKFKEYIPKRTESVKTIKNYFTDINLDND